MSKEITGEKRGDLVIMVFGLLIGCTLLFAVWSKFHDLKGFQTIIYSLTGLANKWGRGLVFGVLILEILTALFLMIRVKDSRSWLLCAFVFGCFSGVLLYMITTHSIESCGCFGKQFEGYENIYLSLARNILIAFVAALISKKKITMRTN
ncbi:MAG: hypothetical protein SGI98_02040 [Verrucomicrobiota bacterium]|nr:hypothetical protein [Verrucomicrobiota bacterium]